MKRILESKITTVVRQVTWTQEIREVLGDPRRCSQEPPKVWSSDFRPMGVLEKDVGLFQDSQKEVPLWPLWEDRIGAFEEVSDRPEEGLERRHLTVLRIVDAACQKFFTVDASFERGRVEVDSQTVCHAPHDEIDEAEVDADTRQVIG